MATYYVSSVIGNDTNNGTTWALAKATIAGALAVATSSGDIIYVDSAHAFSATSAAITLDAATSGSNVSIISVNRNGSTTTGHSGWLAGASETVGTNGFGMNIATLRAQVLFIYGVTFAVNNGISSGNLITIGGSSGAVVTLKSVTLTTPGSSSSSGIQFGANTGSGRLLTFVNLYDCTINAPNVAAGRVFAMGLARLFVSNLTVTFNATKPTTFVTVGSSGNNFSRVEIVDSDLSGFNPASSAWVNVLNLTGGEIIFRNCKLNATPGATTGTWPTNNEGSVWFINCDSGTSKTKLGYYNRLGTLLSSESIYRNSGATFGSTGTNVGWDIQTTAQCNEAEPFILPWMTNGYDSHTTSITSAFYLAQASGSSNLHDRNCWCEVEEIGTAASTIGSLRSKRNAQPFDGSSSNWAADGVSTWTGLTTPVLQKVADTFTPAVGSAIRGRLVLAGASLHVYADPQMVVS